MSKRSSQFILALIFCLIFLFGNTFFLWAQEADSEEFTLEEITVTAAKRTEDQQKVPIAMDVISSEEIRELGKNSIDEILSTITNTIIEKAADGYRITIRGITDSTTPFHGQSVAPPAVALNTDGVYSNRKDTGMGLFDIERVEVLYGPQSTMYSSNSPGGVVNILTVQPKLEEFEVSGLLEVGNYSLLHTEGAMNAPLGSKVALRASFSTSKRGSYMTNGADNEDVKAARLRTLFQANDKLSFTITGELSKDKGTGFAGAVPFDTQDGHWYESMAGTTIMDGEVTDPWTTLPRESRASNNQEQRRISARIDWDAGIGDLSLIPAYTKRTGKDIEVFPSATGTESIFYRAQGAKEKAVEARMTSSPDFFFKWIVGANYYLAEDHQKRDSVESHAGLFGEWGDRTMTNKNRAVYFNVTYPITKTFRLTGGYRQSWDKLISEDEGVMPAYPGSGLPPGTLLYSAPSISEMSTEGRPDYKVGFEYDLGVNSMLYGDYSTSYRTNGIRGGPPPGMAPAEGEGQEGAGSRETDEPEELKAYTLGAKNRFFENRLQLNIAAYYYDYRNYYAGNNDVWTWLWDGTGGVADTPPDLVMDRGEWTREPYSNGAGDGRMIGFDMSSIILLTPKDQVNLSVSYLDSEWTDLKMVYYYDYTLKVVNGELVRVDQKGADYSGKPMMSTPPWTIDGSYNHSFTLPNGGAISTTLSVKYRTAFRLSWKDSDYPINYQETFHMEDFQVVYNSPGGKWNFSSYIKNITNYAEKRMYLPGPGNMLSIGNPRTYGAVLSLKF